MARKKKEEGGGPTGNEWLGTYSDMVTLLMTLFVLLYSMSSIDEAKVHAISQAFSALTGKAADSILQYDMYHGSQPIIGGESKVENNEELEKNMDEQTMYESVKQFIKENNLDSSIDVGQNEKGVVLQLKDSILFESGQADLRSGSNEVLDKVNTLISTIPDSIVIEGHTDNVPIHNEKYKDNWDLSSMRATNVLRYFTEVKNQNPERFRAAGYGEFRPQVDNATEENRAKNRRVNILIENNEE